MSNSDKVSKGLQDFIFMSKYARWDSKLGRRETWDEAVDRVCNMHLQKYGFLEDADKDKIRWAFSLVKAKRVLPSMRSMQFAGPATIAHNARGYNCSVRHVDSIRSFAEIAYLMLCGCGTGIGLSKHFLARLPNLVGPDDKTGSVITYVIEDTIEGWADSLEALLMCYFKNNAYSGRKIAFDYSKIRRKGAILKTGGGRAPGYKPLKAAHQRIKKLLDRIIEEDHAQVMRPIHAYDVMMHFADAVLSGGVRRTASSIIFDEDEEEMINAKTYFTVSKYAGYVDEETGLHHTKVKVNKHWYTVDLDEYNYNQVVNEGKIYWKHIEPQRSRSNNSVLLLRNKTSKQRFAEIVEKTKEFGEPGFVWANHPHTLYNPCFEIGFIPVTDDGECGVQFCNLTTLNGNLITNDVEFEECVEAQTIIGTLQAGYTHFPYLSKVAKQLTEEEALLGNSMTGVLGSPDILLCDYLLRNMAAKAVQVNKEWAAKIYINPASRTTAEKPEGTGSLALGVNDPGIHPAHARYFFRRVQNTKGDIVYEYFKKHNPHMCEESKWSANKTDEIITFPLKAKEGAIVKSDLSAIQHLEIIRKIQRNWVIPGGVNNKKDVTNNVSCTVIVKDNEWDDVIDFIYDNNGWFAAVSLLASDGDKVYEQAPFEKIESKEDFYRYNDLLDKYTEVDFTKLSESTDETTLVSEMACAGGACLTS